MVIVIVILKFLKRYSKAKRTRAPTYSRALRRIKGGFQRVFYRFFTRKKPISENNSLMTHFLLCSCFRTHPTNTTSQNIGVTDAWAVPHLKFWGDRPPVPHRSPPMHMDVSRLD